MKQVSSTTGRGRGKGTPRTKKSRKKADKEAAPPIVATPSVQPEQPLSDNLVTPGDSSNIVDSVADSEDNKPSSGGDMEEEWNKNRKSRPPRKPRKPKEPKEPKEAKIKKEPKPPKEAKLPKRKKKSKETKDGSKRGRK